jgi:hypothetical protein
LDWARNLFFALSRDVDAAVRDGHQKNGVFTTVRMWWLGQRDWRIQAWVRWRVSPMSIQAQCLELAESPNFSRMSGLAHPIPFEHSWRYRWEAPPVVDNVDQHVGKYVAARSG